MSVNLSVRQFMQGDMTATVDGRAARGRRPARATSASRSRRARSWDDPPRRATARPRAACAACGVHLDIDDFGTGYSSLSLLSRFPIDALKIDRSFVSGMEGDQEALEIVRAIVEARRHAAAWRRWPRAWRRTASAAACAQLGCHVGQGFLFGRPAPPAEVCAGSPAPAGHA
jgi:EAL domain-containing protein (putative c-di-GMP-specific phosphodiesterase class I)